MRVVYRVGLAFLCVLATPMAAWAVRPHASGSLVGYRGVDPEGPVSFTILITDSSHGSDYSASGFRIATECNRAGVRLPDSVTITRHERGTPRTLHFNYRRRGVAIALTVSGPSLSTARGTVQISSRRCDGDTLPFRASAVP